MPQTFFMIYEMNVKRLIMSEKFKIGRKNK